MLLKAGAVSNVENTACSLLHNESLNHGFQWTSSVNVTSTECLSHIQIGPGSTDIDKGCVFGRERAGPRQSSRCPSLPCYLHWPQSVPSVDQCRVKVSFRPALGGAFHYTVRFNSGFSSEQVLKGLTALKCKELFVGGERNIMKAVSCF